MYGWLLAVHIPGSLHKWRGASVPELSTHWVCCSFCKVSPTHCPPLTPLADLHSPRGGQEGSIGNKTHLTFIRVGPQPLALWMEKYHVVLIMKVAFARNSSYLMLRYLWVVMFTRTYVACVNSLRNSLLNHVTTPVYRPLLGLCSICILERHKSQLQTTE